MTVFETRVVAVSIERAPLDVYAFITNPENLALWADGLSPEMKVTFVDANDYGVADHLVITPDGDAVMNPMRIIANGDGAEVTFTLFRRPNMTVEQLAEDERLVTLDLERLKTLLETS